MPGGRGGSFPRVPASLVPRDRLDRRLNEALRRRLTIVTAGPGYGKTTLLSAWASRVGAVWYAVEPADSSPAVLAGSLVGALRPRLALTPEAERAVRSAPRGAEDPSEADRLARLVARALESGPGGGVALVLDGAEEILPGTGGAWVLQALCRQAPPRLHLILSSRMPPPFEIERLKGRGEVLWIDSSLLGFSEEETAGLLKSILGDGSQDLARPIHEATGGWPAAVRLAAETLLGRDPSDRADALQDLRRPGGAVFGYLAGEVFAAEPPAVRALLRVAAPFGRVTGELCEALGVGGAGEILDDLLRLGLLELKERGPRGWFLVHDLIREFALERWPLGEDEARSVHGLAAAWFLRVGMPVDALRAFAAARDHQATVRL